jgi:GT2 family glycosyltransferase
VSTATGQEPGAAALLSVMVATQNRPRELARCLRSLARLGPLLAETLVVDDGSETPVEGPLREELGAGLPPTRWLRNHPALGLAGSRNRAAREATAPYLLNLDDDAFVVSRAAVEQGLAILRADPAVVAVAFAQADAEGALFPPAAQQSPVQFACYVPTFTGFGFLIRREALLAAGGFRERLGIHGEEKELCLRLLDRGLRVVYLPHAGVGHLAATAGRDLRHYLHQTVRNSTLGGLYNEPFPQVLAGAGVRLYNYFPMRRGWRVEDRGGFTALLRALARELPAVLRERRPVRRATWRRWRRMTQSPPEPYLAPAAGAP